MELVCRIIEQGVLNEREFTNRDGNPERFASMPFTLQHGSDVIYAEMVQDTARKMGQLDKAYFYVATLNFQVRKYTDKDGRERFETRAICSKIVFL